MITKITRKYSGMEGRDIHLSNGYRISVIQDFRNPGKFEITVFNSEGYIDDFWFKADSESNLTVGEVNGWAIIIGGKKL